MTLSEDFPLAQAIDSTFQGAGEAFVTKLSPDGRTLVYSTYLGGSAQRADEGNAIAVDQYGNAYVGGQTSSSDFPTMSTAFQPRFAGGLSDGFVTVFSRTGQTLYSTYLGGNAGANQMLEVVNGIAVDQFRQIYVTGDTDATNFPIRTALQSALKGAMDAFVAKFGPGGQGLVYSTYLGGARIDGGSAIAVNSAGEAHVTGQTRSSNFPVRTPFQPALAGAFDAFVTKLTPQGSALAYSSYLGGREFETYAVGTVDAAGNVYMTGLTNSSDFPLRRAFDSSLGGGAEVSDAFVAKIVVLLSGSACITSAGTWQHRSLSAQTGTSMAEFDATPASAVLDGVMGLSNGPATAYTHLAAIVRFNTAGFIDARNGSSYAAQTSIPYRAGVTYHFRLVVNISNHTYMVCVRAGGAAEQVVGTNYAFRTEQQTVSTLNTLNVYASTGSVTICKATVGP